MKAVAHVSVLLLVLALTIGEAVADVSRRDLQILGRALSFLESPPSGVVRIGVVYSSSDTRTRRHANEIRSVFDGGLQIGNIRLEPALVATEEAGNADVDVFLIPDSFPGDVEPISAASSARGIPCATTDVARVREGACTLGVRSQPKIEILVNRAMAEKANTKFATAFRMMITEI